MTNLEIDRALALAIGWPDIDDGGYVEYRPKAYKVITIPRRFSHLDPAVIWPIAERFNCFPGRHPNGYWLAAFSYNGKWIEGIHACPATAVALAVIEANR